MKQKISIVGGGVCALILGSEIDPAKYEVAIYEKNAAPGRKFLVAGEGGLNLTHSEPAPAFILRYSPFQFMEKAFGQFSNISFVNWINGLGIDTYIGSSGRVFPKKGIKPIQVLNVLLQKVKSNGVKLYTKHEWKGFADDDGLIFEQAAGQTHISSDLVIFCLGGASWPVTGSTGNWAGFFQKKSIHPVPFEASNCAFLIQWPEALSEFIEGKALKNCSFRCGSVTQKGEVVLTSTGIEGSGIYPLSSKIRKQLHESGRAEIFIDLKPSLTGKDLLKKMANAGSATNYSNHVGKQLNLNKLQMALLKHFVSKSDFLDPEKLVSHIKNLKLIVTGMGTVEESISTVGGIDLQEIDEHFELKKLPGRFVIGEMLDFDAPTGGYLLQACFTMSKSLADYLNKKQIGN